MFLAAWIAFLFVMLFLLGSAVGSFLNVCIVRLPQGRSLIRPASCCGNCHKPIRIEDNLPLISYWRLRGRCRDCGAPFSMRYFWIELLTGLAFVLIYHLEIGWNVHHLEIWSFYSGGYDEYFIGKFPPHSWLIFGVHAVMSCFLIVAVMSNREYHRVPTSVTYLGVLMGLLAALLFPWPWPTRADLAVRAVWDLQQPDSPLSQLYVWGRRVGSMSAEDPWWKENVTPRAGLYSWPVWGPLPDWLPPGSWRLGLATGLAGVLAGAVLTSLVRLLFNLGVGAEALGRGEMSLLTIAGGFLGWQPIVVAGLLALIPGLAAVTVQWTVQKRNHVSYNLWLVLSLVPVWLGWYWIGPLVQGLFFDRALLSMSAVGCVAFLIAFSAALRLAGVARPEINT